MPGTAAGWNGGFDSANLCGAYHGMFGTPAHGEFGSQVRAQARSGVYRGGFVGDNASNPLCHERDAGT
jgi:hypothetical protein